MFVRPNSNVAIGAEWQFGRRIAFNDQDGDNSRLFFGVELTNRTPESTEDRIETKEINRMYHNGYPLGRDSQLFNQAETQGSHAHMQSL